MTSTLVQQLQSAGIKAEDYPRETGRVRIGIKEDGKEGVIQIESRERDSRDRLVVGDLDHRSRQALIRRWRSDGRGSYRITNLLVGMDETHNFISIVPGDENDVYGVVKAHQILRNGAPRDAKRQGEWFFIPTPQAFVKRATKKALVHNGHRTTHVVAQYAEDEWGRMYARGKVTETREGRHAPLDLGETWHRVEHNGEVEADPVEYPGHRYFD